MYPSLVEVDRSDIGLDPSSVEVIVFVVGYGPYPSSVEVDCGCIASVALREEFGTPIVD